MFFNPILMKKTGESLEGIIHISTKNIIVSVVPLENIFKLYFDSMMVQFLVISTEIVYGMFDIIFAVYIVY